MTFSRIGLAFATTLFALPVSAHDYMQGALKIDHPWVRATAPGAPVAGGFMTITNTGDETDRLVGGEAGFAKRVEMHEMSMDDGVMRMRELQGGIEIAPGETVTLKPGGLHIMFMKLSEPMTEGEKRPVTLTFENAGDISIDFAVEGMAHRGSAKPMKHEGH